jgi:uncharacterized protein
MEPRISLLTLAVNDLKHSVAFYEALGWKRADAEEHVAFFQLGPAVLCLYPRTSLARDMRVTPHGEKRAEITIAYNTRTKEEVEVAVERFTSAGGSVIRTPFIAHWGGTIAYVADIDGHVWEIAYNPTATVREDGGFVI